MTVQRVRWITAVATLLLAALQVEVRAQMGPGQPYGYGPQPVAYGGQSGVMPAAMTYGAGGSYPMPGAMDGVYAMPPGGAYAGDASLYNGGILADGQMGCADGTCSSRHGRAGGRHWGSGVASILGVLAPYGEGGCCAPHWLDIHAEAVFMNLDDDRPFTEFSRDTSGNTRISSNDLAYDDDQPGLRITGAHQTGAGSNLEFTYLGMFDFNQARRVFGTEDLLSVFSDFTNLNPPDGLEQFDLANDHRVAVANDFDSLELNFRRRWIGPTCLVQGSWLAGIRYISVEEQLRWRSFAERDSDFDGVPDTGGIGRYNLDTTNYMTGFQLGGDMWMCLIPGLNVGVDGKFGVYGNNAKQHTRIYSIDIFDNFIGIVPDEKVDTDQVSFVGEISLMVNYRINQNFTLRAGYEVVFIDGVALAFDNFNPDIPTLTTRTAMLDNDGSLVYDGVSIGAEWMW